MSVGLERPECRRDFGGSVVRYVILLCDLHKEWRADLVFGSTFFLVEKPGNAQHPRNILGCRVAAKFDHAGHGLLKGFWRERFAAPKKLIFAGRRVHRDVRRKWPCREVAVSMVPIAPDRAYGHDISGFSARAVGFIYSDENCMAVAVLCFQESRDIFQRVVFNLRFDFMVSIIVDALPREKLSFPIAGNSRQKSLGLGIIKDKLGTRAHARLLASGRTPRRHAAAGILSMHPSCFGLSRNPDIICADMELTNDLDQWLSTGSEASSSRH